MCCLVWLNFALGAVFALYGKGPYPLPTRWGLFQGVRMVFWVLLPMVIGPLITAIITTQSSVVGIDEYGQKKYMNIRPICSLWERA